MFTHHSLVRAAADECLSTVLGPAYGQLTIDQASRAIDALIDLANREGLDSLYAAAERVADRLPTPTSAALVALLGVG